MFGFAGACVSSVVFSIAVAAFVFPGAILVRTTLGVEIAANLSPILLAWTGVIYGG